MKLWTSNNDHSVSLVHTSDLIDCAKERYPKDSLLSYPHYKSDKIKDITGEEFAEKCLSVAKALVAFQIKPQEFVGIYSPNRQEILYCELGLFAIRGASVPFYFTASPDQVEYICRKTNIKLLFVGEQYQYNNAYQVQAEKGQIERIVIFDKRVVKQFNDHTSIYYDEFVRLGNSMRNETIVKQRKSEVLASDIALCIFTSGTSGRQKGVLLTHRSIVAQINAHQQLYSFVNKRDVSADFLPQSHIFEKMWVYFSLSRGVKTVIISDPNRVQFLLPIINPTLMCNVPRYWEKVYESIQEKRFRLPRWQQFFFEHALQVGKKYQLNYRNKKKPIPLYLQVAYRFYYRLFFRKIKIKLGLQRGVFFPTAGAYLNDTINEFLQSCGFPIIIGYGLSESCATVSAYPRKGYIIGSIGEVVPQVALRIDAETQEIQLKGETIMSGYYDEEEATAKAFTEDGWFRTGDAGRMEGNTLFFIERIKDLFKTANGKYIAPQQIENILLADALIEQVACIANNRRFASALIYPNWSRLIALAKEKGILVPDDTPEKLCQNESIKKLLISQIEKRQGALANYEKIKRIALLSQPFTEKNGDLTATMKLRREAIEMHYKDLIDALYRDPAI